LSIRKRRRRKIKGRWGGIEEFLGEVLDWAGRQT
jgi:hypothetical protein